MINVGIARRVSSLLQWVWPPQWAPSWQQKNALFKAAIHNKFKEMQNLLDKGADVNAKSIGGLTVLMHASLKGHHDAVKLLLDKGSDVNATAAEGLTALMMASKKGHSEVVKLLELAYWK